MAKELARRVCEGFGRQNKKAKKDTGVDSKRVDADGIQGRCVVHGFGEDESSLLTPVFPVCNDVVCDTVCSSPKEPRLILGGGARDTAHPPEIVVEHFCDAVEPELLSITVVNDCSSMQEPRRKLRGGARDTAHPPDSEDKRRTVLSEASVVTE